MAGSVRINLGAAERAAHDHYADSAEHREGLVAFKPKRPPQF